MHNKVIGRFTGKTGNFFGLIMHDDISCTVISSSHYHEIYDYINSLTLIILGAAHQQNPVRIIVY